MTKRVALITDVTHFLGKPVACALAADGIVAYGCDPDLADPQRRKEAETEAPDLKLLDVSTPGDAVAAVLEAEGRLDILVNNDAYPAVRAPLKSAGREVVRDTFEALVFKSFEMAQAALAPMLDQGAGKMIFVTSAAPLNGLPNYAPYVAARGAANALALSLSKELAGANIQVNAVAPNFIESPDYFPPSLMEDPISREKILKNIPLGRLGKPEEAAAVVAFLASPAADFVTGQVIPLAGGWANAR